MVYEHLGETTFPDLINVSEHDPLPPEKEFKTLRVLRNHYKYHFVDSTRTPKGPPTRFLFCVTPTTGTGGLSYFPGVSKLNLAFVNLSFTSRPHTET